MKDLYKCRHSVYYFMQNYCTITSNGIKKGIILNDDQKKELEKDMKYFFLKDRQDKIEILINKLNKIKSL